MDSNNEVPTKAASPTSDYQMGNPNSTNIAGFHQSDNFSLECHCPHQKADQTTIKPVCMRCPCLGKTTTLHLRYVSYGRQQ